MKPIVMIVDDSRSNRRMLQRLVQKLGCDVLLGEDGLDALEKLQAAPEPGKKGRVTLANETLKDARAEAPGHTAGESVCLILLDFSMPRMDGPTLAAALKRDPRYSGIPIVGVTGNALEQDRDFFLGSGASEIAMKPVTRGKVEGLLDKYVHRKKI